MSRIRGRQVLSEGERRRREERILEVVREIPRGRVATYGQVAALAGLPRGARQVGRALAALEDEEVPWHRVINAQGRISERASPGVAEPLQRQLLEAEGIEFRRGGSVDLGRYQWEE